MMRSVCTGVERWSQHIAEETKQVENSEHSERKKYRKRQNTVSNTMWVDMQRMVENDTFQMVMAEISGWWDDARLTILAYFFLNVNMIRKINCKM